MAKSYNSYGGNGSTQVFSLTFPYLAKSHVKVYVGGVEDTTFTWLTSSSITLTAVPANGAIILIKRVTPTTPLIDFVDGSVVTESLLDTATIQSMYVAEETQDTAATAITFDPIANNWQGNSKVLANIADPVDAQDAVTKHWAQTAMDSELAQATAQATTATTKASEAATSANAAANSASTSTNKATEAATSATNSANSATASAASASASAASASTASTKASEAAASATNAAGSASTANTKATEAANSASSASSSASNAANSASAASASASTASTGAATATAKASEAAASALDPNVIVIGQDLQQAGVTNIADYGSIDDPATSTGVGTSYIKTVKDNLPAIQTAAANANTASTQAGIATTKATEAATSATNSANSATNSANSATAAAASAGTATTQATNSASSASEAATSATTASTKATEAATSAMNAATSETNAAASATTANTHKVAAQAAQAAAEAARDQTLTAYDQFDDRYLGTKTADPSVDNDGNALIAGALYFNSSTEVMKLYTGSAWVAAYVSGSGFVTSTTTISAGSGLTGGGDLSANRSIGIATGGVTASMLASTLDLGTI